jgi:hypothetical protein
MFPGLTEAETAQVIGAVRAAVARHAPAADVAEVRRRIRPTVEAATR